MLKEKAKLFSNILFSLDILFTFLSFFAAYFIRDFLTSKLKYLKPLFPLKEYIWMLLFIIPVWAILFKIFRLYKSKRLSPFCSEIWQIFKVLFIANLLLGSFIFALKYYYISRPLIFLFAFINFAFLTVERALVRLIMWQIRKDGYNYRTVVIVGINEEAKQFAKIIEKNSHWGLRLLGFISESNIERKKKVYGYPIIGKIKDIPMLIKKIAIDEIAFCLDEIKFEKLNPLLLISEEAGITTRIVCNFFPLHFAKTDYDTVEGLPHLIFSPIPNNETAIFIKRVIDFFVSFSFIIILSPLFLLIAILIKLTSPGPVIFKQLRVGLNGRRFTLYKFRSMISNAEEMKKEFKSLNIMQGPVFKIEEDPRLTKVGKFLRKFSLDELPQLWNVVKGEMSLVAPRPPIPEEVEKYNQWQRRRLSVHPGITCIWQTYGRNKISDFNEWAKLDLQYIDNWSLWLDFKILLMTLPPVLISKGAV